VTSTVTVYRVEHHQTGEGPYNGPYWDRYVDMAMAHRDRKHPAPWMDRDLSGIRSDEVCACDSPKSLRDWFARFWGDLADAGYVVRVYDVPERHVRTGKHGQAVFHRASALQQGTFTAAGFLAWFTLRP
jgi:hypothetical protein